MSYRYCKKTVPVILVLFCAHGCSSLPEKPDMALSFPGKIDSHLKLNLPGDPEKFAECMAPLTAHAASAMKVTIDNDIPHNPDALDDVREFFKEHKRFHNRIRQKIINLSFGDDTQNSDDILDGLGFFKLQNQKDKDKLESIKAAIKLKMSKFKDDAGYVEKKLKGSTERAAWYFEKYFEKAVDDKSLSALLSQGIARIEPDLAKALKKQPGDPAVAQALNELLPKAQSVLLSALEKSKPELAAELKKAAGSAPTSPATAAALQTALQNLMAELSTGLQLALASGMDSTGFVGREGTVYSFPGVDAKSGSAKIDHNQIGADAIRIFFESLRDSFAPLPVLATSTAAKWNEKYCKQENSCDPARSPVLSFKAADDAAGVQIEWQVDPIASSPEGAGSARRPALITVRAKDFQDIEAKARDIESATATVVGKLIRGSGNMGANEALARAGETAAGVAARHVAERWGWCVLYSDANAARR